MIIRFNEQLRLTPAEAYSYFRTPADWTRVFGFAGPHKVLGNGWYSVALKRFPFPLVAKNVAQEPYKLVRWVFRGFWRGMGEVRFAETGAGVLVTGFEEIAVRPLFFLSPLVERVVLEKSFHAIWGIGWHRLRKLNSIDPVAAGAQERHAFELRRIGLPADSPR